MTDNEHHEHVEDMDCLEAIEQIYAYLDGELEDQASVERFEKHMRHCRSCFSRKELETRLNSKIQESVGGDAPESLKRRLRNLIDSI